MSDEKKEKDARHPARSTDLERNERGHPARSTDLERDERGLPETNFLPPLNMFLAFFDKKKKKKGTKHEDPDEKNVEKLIEKLSENEENKK